MMPAGICAENKQYMMVIVLVPILMVQRCDRHGGVSVQYEVGEKTILWVNKVGPCTLVERIFFV